MFPTESDLARLTEIVRGRRTHMLVDRDKPVPVGLVEQLCDLATWAPNHKRTWPWRFALFTGEGRSRLGQAFAADMDEHCVGDQAKRTKTLTKYLRAPAVLVVGCADHEHPTFHEENRDAVSAGIQNLLLGATAAGLASFWSTAAVMQGNHSLSLCRFDPGTRIIGVIYLGWPISQVEAPARPPVALSHIAT
jgi:nitroreductase